MRRAEIEAQNRYLLKQQHRFRLAADVVTDALVAFPEVEAVAVIGSVAKPLWKEVPRFREYRRAGIEVWHECKDLDLAVWLSSQHRLGELRRARDLVLRDAEMSVATSGAKGGCVRRSTCRRLQMAVRCPVASRHEVVPMRSAT
jgi:hypothetical protein